MSLTYVTTAWWIVIMPHLVGSPVLDMSVGSGADPGPYRQSAHRWQVKPSSRLPLISARPGGYLPNWRASPPFGQYQIILLGNRGTCVLNNLHMEVERPGFEPATSYRESSAITITPPCRSWSRSYALAMSLHHHAVSCAYVLCSGTGLRQPGSVDLARPVCCLWQCRP